MIDGRDIVEELNRLEKTDEWKRLADPTTIKPIASHRCHLNNRLDRAFKMGIEFAERKFKGNP